MFQDAPIYHQLVAERGDVPARVRDAAQTIRLELDEVMRTGQRPGVFEPGPSPLRAAPLSPGPHPR
jgi:hypothetical protein